MNEQSRYLRQQQIIPADKLEEHYTQVTEEMLDRAPKTLSEFFSKTKSSGKVRIAT